MARLKQAALLLAAISMMIYSEPMIMDSFAEQSQVERLAREFSEEEKQKQITELLLLGDQLVENKDYNRANEAYEQVFLLDPENIKASAKIDVLKKQMMQEGRDEASVVSKVYDEEIQERIRRYWEEIRENLRQKKIGRARLGLQKILLLNPMDRQAKELYEQLSGQHGEIKT